MTCKACTNALDHPRSPEFAPNCDSCCARAIASTSMFQASIDTVAKSPQYRMALAHFFPGPGTEQQRGDRMAREWLQRIRAKGVAA